MLQVEEMLLEARTLGDRAPNRLPLAQELQLQQDLPMVQPQGGLLEECPHLLPGELPHLIELQYPLQIEVHLPQQADVSQLELLVEEDVLVPRLLILHLQDKAQQDSQPTTREGSLEVNRALLPTKLLVLHLIKVVFLVARVDFLVARVALLLRPLMDMALQLEILLGLALATLRTMPATAGTSTLSL